MAFNQQQQQQPHQFRVTPSSLRSDPITSNNHAHSHLEESEWILFSPANSAEEATSYDHADILSSISNNTLNKTSTTEGQAIAADDDGVSDVEDSLLDSFNDEIMENKSSIYSNNNDLETRINNWRKDQIHDLLNEMTNGDSISSYRSNTAADLEKIEFMKSWGIDDGKIRLKKNKRKYKLPKKELRDIFYGSELLKGFNNGDLKTIRKLIQKLAKELTIDEHQQRVKETSFHSNYLRNLQERNKDLRITNINHQMGLLHNPDLEKFLPMFIKDLIIENKNKSDIITNGGIDSSPFHAPLSHKSSNFWDSDLKSCKSSVLSMSSNSMMFKFNLNDCA